MSSAAPDPTSTMVVLLALDPAREAVVRSALRAVIPHAGVVVARDVAQALEAETRARAFVFAQGLPGDELQALAEAEKSDGSRRWIVVALDADADMDARPADPGQSRGVVCLRAADARVEVISGVLLAVQGLAGQVGEISRLRGDLRSIARKISHEFRSGLGCIITSADLLTEILEDAEEARPMLAGIAEAAGEITTLIDRISLVTRASGQPLPLETFSAGDSYWEAWENAGAILREAGAEVTQPEEWPEVRGVPAWCVTIWQGLLENAARHGGPKPRIQVSWTETDEGIRFNVRDSGPGVTARGRGKLFLPFSRLADTDSSEGLTLTLLERLASLQQGICGYEEPGDARGGSCFFFTLSRARPQTAGETIPPAAGAGHAAEKEEAPIAAPGDSSGQREAKDALARQTRRSDLLARAAATLLESDATREKLPGLLAELAAGLGAEIHLEHLLDPAQNALRLESSTGLDENTRARFAEFRLGGELCGAVAESRAPLVLENLRDRAHDAPAALRSLGVGAFACHPLQARNQILGTLSFATTSRSRFDTGEISAMRLLAGLVSANMEQARLSRELKAARADAGNASRAKDEFIAALAHELRAPLSPALLIASEAAADESLPPAARADFEAIGRGVSSEAKLIDALLDLTRVARGELVLEDSRLDLHAILRDALARIESEAAEKQIVLDLIPAARNPVIRGDAARLEQVFWNLLKHAMTFTPDGGCVQVMTENDASGGNMVVRIQDTGLGLTEIEAQHIFHAFEGEGDGSRRAHRDSPGGPGLGLMISRSLVEMHGGSIGARSEGRGRGTVFEISLPAAAESDRGPEANDPAPGLPAEKEEPRTAPSSNNRVLLVEDHEPTRLALMRLLGRRGYHVTDATCLADARSLALSNDFDLLVSDIGLPDGAGYQLMEEIRQRSSMPGIALTGYGMEQDVSRSQAAGFAVHLTKPIRVEVLDAALRRVAAGTSRESGDSPDSCPLSPDS